MSMPRTLLLAAALLACTAAPAIAETPARTAFSVGAGLHPLGSAGPLLQLDRRVGDRVWLGLRVLGLEYTYEEDGYTEWGDGRGAELLVSYHFRDGGFAGPYLSAGLGHFSADWDYREAVSRGVRTGFGRTNGAQVSVSLGWKWPLGPRLYVDPALTIGHFFGSGKDNTGSRESELGTYGAATVKLGWRF
jgi:hypothetical protein